MLIALYILLGWAASSWIGYYCLRDYCFMKQGKNVEVWNEVVRGRALRLALSFGPINLILALLLWLPLKIQHWTGSFNDV